MYVSGLREMLLYFGQIENVVQAFAEPCLRAAGIGKRVVDRAAYRHERTPPRAPRDIGAIQTKVGPRDGRELDETAHVLDQGGKRPVFGQIAVASRERHHRMKDMRRMRCGDSV